MKGSEIIATVFVTTVIVFYFLSSNIQVTTREVMILNLKAFQYFVQERFFQYLVPSLDSIKARHFVLGCELGDGL